MLSCLCGFDVEGQLFVYVVKNDHAVIFVILIF